MSDLTERLCEEMHDRYEAAAASEGWETQQASRKPWADVPEANKATMRAAVRPIAYRIDELEAEVDELEAMVQQYESMTGIALVARRALESDQ